MKTLTTTAVRGSAYAITALILFSILVHAQGATPTAPVSDDAASAVRDLRDQVSQLRSLVEQMRAENAESRSEMHQLRQDLQSTRALLERPTPGGSQANPASTTTAEERSALNSGTTPTGTSQMTAPLDERVQKLEESTSLIGSKIDEQYQTKVESASKYRARLHGIVLLNAFRNVGSSDNLDFPSYSEPVRREWPAATDRRNAPPVRNRL